MPTYEYHCTECGFNFEEFQSMAAEPLHVCPKCGGKVRRLISAGGGIIFKGSGFYETDYKHKSWNESSKTKGKPAESTKKGKEKVTSDT